MLCAVIVVAAGRGSRAGGTVPKQYRVIGGESVLRRSLRLFAEHPEVGAVQAVIHPDDADLFSAAGADLEKLLPAVAGGADRQASVRAGLDALGAIAPDIVLVHDAARPFASPALVARAIAAANEHGAAVPGIAVTDTVKLVDAAGHVEATPERARLRAVQTPQAFRYAALWDAHTQAHAAGAAGLTDDAAVMEWAGHKVTVFEGEAENVKLTHPADMARAERGTLTDIRTGTGFDVHAFGDGDHVMLGGVAIPFERGLDGHSDADVGLHALTDAVLGALCDGDIGAHFPPSDPQWKGATSDRFLAFAVERARARGGVVAHLDLTLICEAPKVGPHRDAIRQRIADIAGLPLHRVSVKATTTERLGFTGRREGIAAMASATVRLPEEDGGMIDADVYARAERVLEVCRAAGLTIATAESCTGGLVAGALTAVPGSSDVVDRGFVTYSNAAKVALIGVPEATLAQFGAVSEQTARAMAEGALKAAGTSLAVAITGVAGPGGGSVEKPVGLVHFGAARQGREVQHREMRFGPISRDEIRKRSVLVALEMLEEMAG